MSTFPRHVNALLAVAKDQLKAFGHASDGKHQNQALSDAICLGNIIRHGWDEAGERDYNEAEELPTCMVCGLEAGAKLHRMDAPDSHRYRTVKRKEQG